MTNFEIPDEFCKVLKDFVRDIKTTFPEYTELIRKWWKDEDYFYYIEDESERKAAVDKYQDTSIRIVFDFVKKKYPPRFFDILYQNEEIFEETSLVDTEFLPHIHFKNLWQVELTKSTREFIWKYLQLILFSIINTVHDKNAFGDSFKLLENIDEEDFKSKLQEALSKIQDIFVKEEDTSKSKDDSDDSNTTQTHFNMEDLPDAEGIHKHMTGMLDGKLGKLAKEIAEETAGCLNIDMENIKDTKDIFNCLFQDPSKLMGLFKNVGEKLESQMKSGNLKESEIISEATDIMNKMKNMPGMDGIQELLSKMGNTKLNQDHGAMTANLNKKKKAAEMKERIQAKALLKEAQKLSQSQSLSQSQVQTSSSAEESARRAKIVEDELIALFDSAEKPEKSDKNGKNGKNGNSDKNRILDKKKNNKKKA
jgi:hypothetical protein